MSILENLSVFILQQHPRLYVERWSSWVFSITCLCLKNKATSKHVRLSTAIYTVSQNLLLLNR